MIYGYVRVSTAKQADEGDSLGAQERTLKGYAMMKGIDEPHIYVETGVSGSIKFSERPQGAKLLALLQPGDSIIVPKLDRAFRSALDALEVFGKLKAMPAHLHMIDLGGDVMADGMSKLVFTILAAVAEGERDRIRERVIDSVRDRRARNVYLGGIIPWGHQVSETGTLEVLPGYEDALAFMKATRQSHSLRATADAMKKYGFKISHEKVRQVLEAA